MASNRTVSLRQFFDFPTSYLMRPRYCRSADACVRIHIALLFMYGEFDLLAHSLLPPLATAEEHEQFKIWMIFLVVRRKSQHELSQTQPLMNPFAALSSTKNQINNSVLKNKKHDCSRISFFGGNTRTQ